MIRLDILSDPICPWCYIGKARLDRALMDRHDHPFALEWHPYQLNPDMPPEGIDRRTYMEAKFGGVDGAKDAYAPILEAVETEELEVNWDAIERVPNTRDAHRLIHWAGLEGRQTAAVSTLFRAYFREGRDIGQHDVLTDLAEGIEMDPDMVRRLLASEADLDEIQRRDSHARARGVTGVPTFVIGNAHVVPGAQSTELWLQVVDEIAEDARG